MSYSWKFSYTCKCIACKCLFCGFFQITVMKACFTITMCPAHGKCRVTDSNVSIERGEGLSRWHAYVTIYRFYFFIFSKNIKWACFILGAYPDFYSMKRLGITPPWTGCQSITGLSPNIKFVGTHFIHLGGERHCESKVSYPKTQNNVPDQCSSPDCAIRSH